VLTVSAAESNACERGSRQIRVNACEGVQRVHRVSAAESNARERGSRQIRVRECSVFSHTQLHTQAHTQRHVPSHQSTQPYTSYTHRHTHRDKRHLTRARSHTQRQSLNYAHIHTYI
jgi:hypothetical protein